MYIIVKLYLNNSMKNIIDYIKEYGNLTLIDYPFNTIDSLILSQLSYLQYEKASLDIESKAYPLSDFYSELDTITTHTRASQNNQSLYLEFIDSLRYKDVTISHFVYNFDEENEKQFCAMTFHLPQNIDYIAFRGTDATIIGWKEDFNLSFKQDIPSQLSALHYVNLYQADNTLFLGGHSKGGNLACYAGAFTQKNIKAIYNHDGPSFLKSLPKFNSTPIIKTIPQSSIIGLLMENEKKYQIIQSDATSIMQHDPFTWTIENGDFIYLNDIDNASKTIQKFINSILLHTDAKTRERIIDSLFHILLNTNAKTFKEITLSSLLIAIKKEDIYKDSSL